MRTGSRDSVLDRSEQLRRLREETFDVLVVGGGITGAAAARDAARRGFRTGLLEARDFGEGTSSRSSRLIHGGLRYLEQLEFDLVFEASRERRTLLRIAPHMVRPLEFLFPIYEEGRVGRRKLDAGMWLYDALSLFRNIERHQMLEPEELVGEEPGVRREGLLGGARYYDAQVDDARLVLVTVLDAAAAGAAVANRVELVGLEREEGAVRAARVRTEEGAEWSVGTRLVLNATGPWAGRTLERAGIPEPGLLRPTRGTHVLLERERLGHERALIFESPLDRRIMFVLPWGERTMIGTTDEDDRGAPEEVAPTAGDVSYLLDSVNRLFPEAELGPEDVLSAWAGLRPLVAGEGGDGGTGAEEVSRDFVVREEAPGLLTIAGGKLTSHRHMAEELVDRAADFLEAAFDVRAARGCDTRRAPLPGGDFSELAGLCDRLRERAVPHRLPGAVVDRLGRAYGTRAARVLELLEERPAWREPVVAGRPVVRAEVVHAARREMAVHVEDVLWRRTHLGQESRRDFETARDVVTSLMGEALGWDGERRRAEAERADAVRARDEAWRKELEQVAGGAGRAR